MKLTKNYLKSLIKECINENVINEGSYVEYIIWLKNLTCNTRQEK